MIKQNKGPVGVHKGVHSVCALPLFMGFLVRFPEVCRLRAGLGERL